jgi:hypothetical protein
MTGELIMAGMVMDERSRRIGCGDRDIEVVDRCMGKGSIIPGVTAISTSKG